MSPNFKLYWLYRAKTLERACGGLVLAAILTPTLQVRSQPSIPVDPPEPSELPQPVAPPETPELPRSTPLPPVESPLNSPNPAPPSPEVPINVPGTIIVDEFQFDGSSVFSDAELREAVAEFHDRPISFAQLLQAADRITELYVRQGYITSGAYIPAQSLESNTVTIQILEGSLSEIQVNVLKGGLQPEFIRDRLRNATDTPLNVNELREALQLLQFNPLIENLDAELATGVRPGTNILTVGVIGADTFYLQPSINNNRNPTIGSFERGIELGEANLLGIGDEIVLAYRNTDGSDSFEGSYTIPINASDGTISFDFRIAENQIVEPPFEDLDIEIDSRDFDLAWRQPVIRRATPEANWELALELTASRRESDTSILGRDTPISPGASVDGETRVSALRLAQEWLRRSRSSVISARSQFSLGADVFDATVNEDAPDSQFLAWRGQLLYLRTLGATANRNRSVPTVLLRTDVQLTDDSLLTVEQFSLGGRTSVRGYRQDELLTDNGIAVSAEARLPFANLNRLGTLQFTPFIDLGTGWNADDEPTEFNTLLGTGVGLLWEIPERFQARLDFGVPLTNTDADDDRTWQENGVYFQLQYNIQ